MLGGRSSAVNIFLWMTSEFAAISPLIAYSGQLLNDGVSYDGLACELLKVILF